MRYVTIDKSVARWLRFLIYDTRQISSKFHTRNASRNDTFVKESTWCDESAKRYDSTNDRNNRRGNNNKCEEWSGILFSFAPLMTDGLCESCCQWSSLFGRIRNCGNSRGSWPLQRGSDAPWRYGASSLFFRWSYVTWMPSRRDVLGTISNTVSHVFFFITAYLNNLPQNPYYSVLRQIPKIPRDISNIFMKEKISLLHSILYSFNDQLL